jgi:hypothetical protein
MTAFASPASPAGADAPHAAFLALLPRLHLHAQLSFRDVACPQRKDDLVAEAVGMGWIWFRRLSARGRDPAHFFAALARFAVRSARCGRGVARPEGRRDALSPAARRRHAFHVQRLPTSTRTSLERFYGAPGGQRKLDVFEEFLADDAQSSPADRAAFRIDLADFLKGLSARDRLLVGFLAQGNTAQEAARAFGLSPGRVSQLRVALCRAWYERQGETAPFERRRRRPSQPSARG